MRIMKFLLLGLCASLVSASLGQGIRADDWNRKTYVTFNESMEIPGYVLGPGTYVFKLADVNDRHVVQIMTEDETHVIASLIAIPVERRNAPEETLFWFDERPSDSPQAIRAWFYPGHNIGNEFVYSSNRYYDVSTEGTAYPGSTGAQP